jgi:hypothetical protein
LALPTVIAEWSLTSLREKVVKIGAKVVAHGRYLVFQMAEVAVPRELFKDILTRIDCGRRTPHHVEAGTVFRRRRRGKGCVLRVPSRAGEPGRGVLGDPRPGDEPSDAPLPCRKALPKALWVGYPAPRPGWARSIWEMSDQALIGRLEPSG